MLPYSVTHSLWFWLVLFVFLALMFFLPIIIAVVRRVDEIWLVILLTVIGGATCVGWPVALIGSFMLPRREPRVRYVPYPPRVPDPEPPRDSWPPS